MRLSLLLWPWAALALGGCSLLFPDDPRLGTEAADDCIERVRATLTDQERRLLATTEGRFVPSYTYDVTQLDLAAMQALIVPGTDETAGARLMQQTNEASTAVAQFMATPVSEQGALFLGRDPALYRVRGKPERASAILASGCARQQANMRLIAISWSDSPASAPAATSDAPDTIPSSETNP